MELTEGFFWGGAAMGKMIDRKEETVSGVAVAIERFATSVPSAFRKTFAVLVLMGCSMNSPSMDKPVFRFEDYKTSDEATRALHRLHPGNTPVAALLETLKKAGAKCGAPKVELEDGEWIRGSGRRGVIEVDCEYRKVNFLHRINWGVGISYDNDGMIYSIATSFYLI